MHENKSKSGLKDFQKATVERVADLFKAGQRRILVCDEVGLGKTLIARGVIQKIMETRKAMGINSLRVAYICSNAVIADQNLARLGARLNADIQQSLAGRLSMQHLQIYLKQGLHGLQLIPLTPATSFNLIGNMAGRSDERALIFGLLEHVPALKNDLPSLERILGKNTKRWAGDKSGKKTEIEKCNKESGNRYIPEMAAAIAAELAKPDDKGQTLLSRIHLCCKQAQSGQPNAACANRLIGSLRFAFAQISIGLLKPDLVIMDEFQRFRTIMAAEAGTETGLLKERFFTGADCAILMLSATPYKLYTTLEEQEAGDIEDHYGEFLQVLEFLQDRNSEKQASFKKVWETYSAQLREFSANNASLLLATRKAEDELYKYICRTERIGEKRLCAGVDSRSVKIPVKVVLADIAAYLECRKLADETGASTMHLEEYAKSAPYLLSLMRNNYQFKRDLERFFRNNPDKIRLCQKPFLWLGRNDIRECQKIPANNGKLDALLQAAFKGGENCLLWVPPALPYYRSGKELFRKNADFSKILIFSAWEMVPRMIASLISYEAERLNVARLPRKNGKADYFADRSSASRLKFTADKKGSPAAMELLTLLYPSRFLTDAWNPIESLTKRHDLGQIRSQLISLINAALKKLPNPVGGKKDGRWHYLAPLLLDDREDAELRLAELEKFSRERGKNREDSHFQKHVAELRACYDKYGSTAFDLGARPDNLEETLADLALASPAVCFARALKPYANPRAEALQPAISLAWLFMRKCLDSSEGVAALETLYGRNWHPWQRAIAYCRDGNLQATLDEYAFILANGMFDQDNCLERLAAEMKEALDFRVASYKAETFAAFKSKVAGKDANLADSKAIFFRTHYCAAFAQSEGSEDDKDLNRKSSARKAFNSPFRPFMLASTSIGQEGLDFHAYCRRIMHWNLPRNPVELEQREGRINRFMCHMIRQNIARRYGGISFTQAVWPEMFEEAERREKTPGCSDLIPWWGLNEKEGMPRIERLVPMFPCSMEIDAYERLTSILALYRLSLGQPCQEEFLENIARACENPESLKKLFINLSPYFRGRPASFQNDEAAASACQ